MIFLREINWQIPEHEIWHTILKFHGFYVCLFFTIMIIGLSVNLKHTLKCPL